MQTINVRILIISLRQKRYFRHQNVNYRSMTLPCGMGVEVYAISIPGLGELTPPLHSRIFRPWYVHLIFTLPLLFGYEKGPQVISLKEDKMSRKHPEPGNS